jgi:hypothetical protein
MFTATKLTPTTRQPALEFYPNFRELRVGAGRSPNGWSPPVGQPQTSLAGRPPINTAGPLFVSVSSVPSVCSCELPLPPFRIPNSEFRIRNYALIPNITAYPLISFSGFALVQVQCRLHCTYPRSPKTMRFPREIPQSAPRAVQRRYTQYRF